MHHNLILRLERHRTFKVKTANHLICCLKSGVVRISIYGRDFTQLLPYSFYDSNRCVTIGSVTDLSDYSVWCGRHYGSGVHTRQNSTHPQPTEALTAGTSPTPDFSSSNRSSETARHTIVFFFSFVHINIVT
jgi:hypothetical protein